MRKPSSKEDFVKKAHKVHNNKYDYTESCYTLSKNKIEVLCLIHGKFSIRASHHLNGTGCSKCTYDKLTKSTSEFISESINIHGDKYDYSLVNYTGAKNKVIIICPKHGEFLQMASSHTRGFGCEKCGYETITFLTEDFIHKATNIHENKYDYSLVEYIHTKNKVKIICKNCQTIFLQTPNSHLSGHGCIKCKKISTLNRTNWNRLCIFKKSTPVLYIIHAFNESEEFIKIGRTSRTTNERFSSGFPYSYKILKEIKGSPDFIFNEENNIQRRYKKFKYLPIKVFDGKTECFSMLIMKDILKHY